MNEPQPSRRKSDLAEMVEMLLDKGIVVNADVVVSIGETEMLGVHVRAAIASFETAAKYGLEFPEGTDMDRVRDAADVEPINLPGDEEAEGEQTTLSEELEIGPESDDGD